MVVNFDHGETGWQPVKLLDRSDVNAFCLEVAQKLSADVVSADSAHHGHPPPKPGRGYRLVGSLAPAAPQQVLAQHRLARIRKPLNSQREVKVDTANDDNFWIG